MTDRLSDCPKYDIDSNRISVQDIRYLIDLEKFVFRLILIVLYCYLLGLICGVFDCILATSQPGLYYCYLLCKFFISRFW